MKQLFLLAAGCALWVGSASAETAYVTDILRLGLYTAQDTSDSPFQNLVSGTELEVLQRVPNYAEVRTPDGAQGWVKSAFLVADKPAQLIVQETKAQLAALKAELANAEAARVRAEQETERVIRETAELVGTTDSIQATMAQLNEENDEYVARLEAYRSSVPLSWAAATLVVTFFAGVLFGVWGLDAYIRHRHGGFRIY